MSVSMLVSGKIWDTKFNARFLFLSKFIGKASLTTSYCSNIKRWTMLTLLMFATRTECKTFSRLEQGWLPGCLRAGNSQTLATPCSKPMVPCHLYPRGLALESSFKLRYLRYMHSIQNLNLNPLNVYYEVVSLIEQGSWVIAGKLAIFPFSLSGARARARRATGITPLQCLRFSWWQVLQIWVSFMTMRQYNEHYTMYQVTNYRRIKVLSKSNLRAQGTSSECSESQLNHEPPSRDLPPLGNMV